MNLRNIFASRMSGFRNVIILFVSLVVFFVFYNIFLVDRSIETLRFSLEQTALAYDIADLDGLDLILNQLLIDEISPEKMALTDVGNLEYATNGIKSKNGYKELSAIGTCLKASIQNKESERGFFLSSLDKLNAKIKSLFRALTARFRPGGPKETKLSKSGTQLFERAKEFENKREFDKALAAYEEFLKNYPAYEKVGLVKLRAAVIYQRKGNVEKAGNMYRDVIRRYAGKKESYIAQALLYKSRQVQALSRKSSELLASLTEVKKEDEAARQDILYQLGVINLKLLNPEEADRFFQRAADINSSNDLGLKARFNRAWIAKQEDRMEDSTAELMKLAKDSKQKDMAIYSLFQLADNYHQEGKFQEAIDLYLKIAEEYKDNPIAPLCLFQAGASYMYDLNNDEKAHEIFKLLRTRYPKSPYAKYVQNENPIGIFITYLVPRASRVVLWRGGGLLALTGYGGDLTKFKLKFDEKDFNKAFREWLNQELPDTVGDIYVDIRNTVMTFLQGKASFEGDLTMGKFKLKGYSEGHLTLRPDGTLALDITKAIIDRVPILPALINNALSGMFIIVRKSFPITVTRLSMEKGEVSMEGYGSKRMLSRINISAKDLMGGEMKFEDFKDPVEAQKFYRILREKFPESDFSQTPKDDVETLFLDFFTRESFYMSFKLLETVKDSKLDYERSVRALNRMMVKYIKFKVSYTDQQVNVSLNKLIRDEFPWLVNDTFLFDVMGLEFNFSSKRGIGFECKLNLGRVGNPIDPKLIKEVNAEGHFSIEIDKDSKIPYIKFIDLFLNGNPFPVEKLNIIARRCLDILKDGRIPFQMEEISVGDGDISLKGEGAEDFLARVFSDPYLFKIFEIRGWDLWAAGVKRFRQSWMGRGGDLYRRRAFEGDMTAASATQQAEAGRPEAATWR